MVEIIPAILARDEKEFMAKVDRVRSLGTTLHIDVMDGLFVPQTTWAVPERMRTLLDDIPFEAHLMVSNPEHAVPIWVASGAKRVIFHVEATTRESMICRATADECKHLSLAINPETPIANIVPMLETFQNVMIMGVPPGKSGQAFQDIALAKVRVLKGLRPSLSLAVDGGVKIENAAAIAAAGADALVVGSALTDAGSPASAYLRLKDALSELRR